MKPPLFVGVQNVASFQEKLKFGLVKTLDEKGTN